MLYFLVFLLFLAIAFIFFYSWYRLHKEINSHIPSNKNMPYDFGLKYYDFSTDTKDGIKIKGWYIPVDSPKAFVILIHGRVNTSGGKSLMLSHAKYLHDNNFSTLLFDCRGVGESDGNKTFLGCREWMDALSIFNYAKNLEEGKNKKIGFFGLSMGASIALITCGKEKIGDFVIASVPYKNFLSLFDMQVKGEKLFPRFIFVGALLIASFFELGPTYFIYTANMWIKKIVAPIFIISAKNDTLVNPKDAWDLIKKASKPSEIWEADSTHNIHGEMKEKFEDKVVNFLNRYAL
ncbi:MAG TPA: alpha/beta hydrolase [Patescibacteria group bacterium]